MTARDSFRALADSLRSRIPAAYGLRTTRVHIGQRFWTSGRIGEGSPIVNWTQILNGGYNPRVKSMTSKDIIASGGFYSVGDYEIGPFTPAYGDGSQGNYRTLYQPQPTIDAADVLVRLEFNEPDEQTIVWCQPKPGVPDNAANFRRVLIVSAMAATPVVNSDPPP